MSRVLLKMSAKFVVILGRRLAKVKKGEEGLQKSFIAVVRVGRREIWRWSLGRNNFMKYAMNTFAE